MVLILVLLLLSRAKSGVAWQLALNCPVVKNEAVPDKGNSDSNDEDFYEIKFIKKGRFTAEELESLVFVLKLTGSGENRILNRRWDTAPTPSMDKSITGLEGMGERSMDSKRLK
nr:katanin p60 ATPase-containing subunit A1 isoform X1 [Tanacetum cinerariifolium]